MFRVTLLRSTLVALAAAAMLPQGALAAGEPKNQWPFTRPATSTAQTAPAFQGEAKNQWPFTRPVGSTPAPSVVVVSASGFSWTDSAIGAVAGIGIALSCGAGLSLARRSPRTA